MLRVRFRSAVGAAATAAAGAAACGGSGFQFVQNDDLGVYAKLPGDWEIYDEHDLFPEGRLDGDG